MQRIWLIALALVLIGLNGISTSRVNAQGGPCGCEGGACATGLGGHGLLSGCHGHIANAVLGWPGKYPSSMPYPPFEGGGPPPQDIWQSGGGGYQNLGVASCCGPHVYDFFLDAVFVSRDTGSNLGLMSQGIRGLAAPNLILQTSGLDLDFEPGVRFGGRFQMSAVHSIEGIYMGGVDWDDRITRTTGANDFYSSFSDFGNLPFGGFEDSDQASSTSLAMDSELDSAEVNYRKAWTTPDYRVSGSYFCGLRYLRVDESLQHRIDVTPHFDPINMINRGAEFTDYNIATNNDMIGPQIGTELIKCWKSGISLGAEGKLGLFANRTSLNSTINSSTLVTPLIESDKSDTLAFMGDGSLFALWKFHPLWTFRAGYEILFIQNAATAPGNYNSAPFLNTDPVGNPVGAPPRVVDTDDDSDMLYNAFFVGIEFGW